jgi:hypothetical protein
MTRISLITLLQEHAELTDGLRRLIDEGAFAEADYVASIMQTDLAEMGHVAKGSPWPRPGEAPPMGWPLYEAAIRWSRDAFRK